MFDDIPCRSVYTVSDKHLRHGGSGYETSVYPLRMSVQRYLDSFFSFPSCESFLANSSSITDASEQGVRSFGAPHGFLGLRDCCGRQNIQS